MLNYSIFTLNKKYINIDRFKYKLYKYNTFWRCRKFRYMIIENSRVSFLKKFIFFCFDYKRSVYYINGICFISGKYNASTSGFIFRRNTLKYLLNYNLIPNIYKKFK